ncbi:MAG: DUF1549 domain-containing protein [Pirellulales bacterium]
MLTRRPAAGFVRLLPALLLGCSAFAGSAHAVRAADGQPPVDYRKEIQPLLARKCYACHGPGTAESGLRFDRADGALGKAADSGEIAIAPKNPAGSEVIRRVTSTDDEARMPPKSHKPLTPAEVDLLKRWIAEGAAWNGHWAFDPVKEPAIPATKNADWAKNPIDAFVLAKLEAAGLKPNPAADKATWLRRATFDATGLPPTQAEVDAFVADASPQAYEKVVDRLLASPHYGERWARHWLDLVRFAETNSFERDGPKPNAWRYRDYVIRAFNDDKPYDRFIKEQLAGDELKPQTPESLIATGYYRLGVWDDEPADREQAKFDGLDDIVANVGQVFLGLTFNCARCHDHKLDPIPQRDYYSLVAFFHNINGMTNNGPTIEAPLYESEKEKTEYLAAVEQRRKLRDELQDKARAIEKEMREKTSFDVAAPDMEGVEFRFYRDTFEKLPDFDSLKAETVGKIDPPYFDIRSASRPDAFGFVFTAQIKVPADGDYTFHLDSDDGSRIVLDGKEILRYDGIHGVGDPKTVTVALKKGTLPIRVDYFQGILGKGLEIMWSGPGFKNRYLTATDGDGVVISEIQKRQPIDLIRKLGPKILGKAKVAEYNKLRKEIDEAGKLPSAAKMALVVTERSVDAPDTFVMQRGNPHVPGDKVEPVFPSILGGGKAISVTPRPELKSSGRRTALADWIASPTNTMTARVMANRIWQQHFGRGIVRSPNNFGMLGNAPTHPELLDWLAGEFVRQGWRMKPLHKQIMLSNAYRMSSAGDEAGLAKDPGNDLFWRFDVRRMSGEELRDALYWVTNEFNETMYGPGIYPTISAEVLAGQSQPGKGWGKTPIKEQARRSVYVHVKRSLVLPLLSTFDFPETDASCEARFVTVQPGQALALMNGEFLHERAGVLADALLKAAGDDQQKQVAAAIKRVLLRDATPAETVRGVQFMQDLQTKHAVTPAEAFRYYCLTVLNRNEFLYID